MVLLLSLYSSAIFFHKNSKTNYKVDLQVIIKEKDRTCETFSPVTKITTIRICNNISLVVHQMDVKTIF